MSNGQSRRSRDDDRTIFRAHPAHVTQSALPLQPPPLLPADAHPSFAELLLPEMRAALDGGRHMRPVVMKAYGNKELWALRLSELPRPIEKLLDTWADASDV